MNWTNITEDEARLHPLYGFAGWLWAIYAVEVLGIGMTLEGVVTVATQYGVENLANPGFGVVWLHVLLNLPFLLMAPMKARAMPIVSIICYWVGILFSLGTLLTFPSSMGMDISILARIAFWIAWGAVFTLYLLRSRRVNVTYRHRVRADEPVPVVPPLEGAA